MFINVADELKKARKDHYAIGAFNTANLEVTKAICQAAKKAGKAIIVQVTPTAITYAGLRQIFDIVKNEIDTSGIEAAIHLDHAKDFEIVHEAIGVGFRSVMIDGSGLSFAENVALTKKVVDLARAKNVSVEGEIGVIAMGEEGETEEGEFSSPEQTKKFIELTGIDSVAVSVGNMHGAPVGEKLKLDLLAEISQEIDIPLVVHGASGLSPEDIVAAKKIGVAKINIDTQIRHSFLEGLKEADLETGDYRALMVTAMAKVEEVVGEKIALFSNQ